MLDEALDVSDESLGAGEGTSANSLLGNEAEPAFDLVEPGRIGRGEMQVVAGTPSEPSADFGMFMSGVVVDDEMDVEGVGHIAVDLTQECEELLMTVSRMTTGDDFAGGDIESGEQRGGAVAFVVMSDAFEVAEAHGEDGLSTLKSLNLGLLIDREHDGVVRGIEVETDDVADFLDEEGVVGNLEMPLAMGLEAEQVEPPLDGALGDSAVPRHRTHAPVGTLGRLGLQSCLDDFGHPFILMGAGTSGTQFIVESADSMVTIALSPLADGCVGEAQAPGHGRTGNPFGAGEHNPGSQHQAMRQGSGAGKAVQFRGVTLTENDGSYGATTWHGHTS